MGGSEVGIEGGCDMTIAPPSSRSLMSHMGSQISKTFPNGQNNPRWFQIDQTNVNKMSKEITPSRKRPLITFGAFPETLTNVKQNLRVLSGVASSGFAHRKRLTYVSGADANQCFLHPPLCALILWCHPRSPRRP